MQQVEKNQIKRKKYLTVGRIPNEDAILESLEDALNYCEGHLPDILNETASENVPTSENELWENARSLRIFVEEFIKENPTRISKDFSLKKAFSCGYYDFVKEMFTDNLTRVLFNLLAERANLLLVEKKLSVATIRGIELDIEQAAIKIRNNRHLENDELDEIAVNIVDNWSN